MNKTNKNSKITHKISKNLLTNETGSAIITITKEILNFFGGKENEKDS